MSLKNKLVALAITLAAAGAVLIASHAVGQRLSAIASAVWGS